MRLVAPSLVLLAMFFGQHRCLGQSKHMSRNYSKNKVRRQQLLAEVEAARVRYRDTGSETRFPFYGRDFGYEVDYMLELGLQPGDRCFAEYRLQALPFTHACAVALRRRSAAHSGKYRCDEACDMF
ncbi:hypothetical protein AK812_SmicGene12354 [Symbiodinium microadriaticum]|uniref:Uncharacterized protein n=1 Tax=Symbiodinium microadriaticum TaxID=2951 RepID=A0A1Q9EAT9_SYMMI|nr:hypothetical protein AK812_SmicGene12354 [Symbiodinium microadriaticum]